MCSDNAEIFTKKSLVLIDCRQEFMEIREWRMLKYSRKENPQKLTFICLTVQMQQEVALLLAEMCTAVVI